MITKNELSDKAPRRPEFSVGLNNKMEYESPRNCKVAQENKLSLVAREGGRT